MPRRQRRRSDERTTLSPSTLDDDLRVGGPLTCAVAGLAASGYRLLFPIKAGPGEHGFSGGDQAPHQRAPDTWTQQWPADVPTYRTGMQLAYDENAEQTVLFGGNVFPCPNTTTCTGAFGRDTWTWDGTDWTRQTPAASPPARAFYQMSYNGASAGVTLFGGQPVPPR